MKNFFEYLFELIRKMQKDEMLLRASGVSFYILLAFFPFVLIVFLISTLINKDVSHAIFKVITLLPSEIGEIVSEVIVNTNASGTLIIVLVGISIWTLSSALVTISKSLNAFYGVKETRKFLTNRLNAFLWSVMLLVLIMIVMILVVFENYVTQAVTSYLNITFKGGIYELIGFAILFVSISLAIALMYKCVPNKSIKFRSVIKGACFSTGLWGICSYGFAVYINNFATYHILYGSIAGVVILVTWIYITSVVILLGGEINSLDENRNNTSNNKII